MRNPVLQVALCIVVLDGTTFVAHAQWITFTNETATRMPAGPGQNDPALTTLCPEEKNYTWGDVDHDGDLDLICMRKRPLECEGGRRNVLFMNENGVLIDRTMALASASLGVPIEQGVSQGMLDPTNDRMAALVDLNNDGWLDIITATTMSDNQPRYIGHPRVYMNLGEVGGVWQGFRYEYERIPQLLSKTGVPCNPRFESVAAGDVTGDGYADLYFSDADTGEASYCLGPPEIASHDMDDKLLVNQGAANPGWFVDETSARLGAMSPATGANNLAFGVVATRGLVADMNGDGIKDLVRDVSLSFSAHVAVLTNPPASVGFWTTLSYKVIYAGGAPYNISEGELNNDGRLDLIISDDSTDRYSINTGNDADAAPNFQHFLLNAESVFSGRSVIADFDNDGSQDVMVFDQDLMSDFVSSRRAHIYHNQGQGAAQQLMEETTPAPVLPFTDAKAVYGTAVFDIDGDGWKDIVLGRGNPSGGHQTGSTAVFINNGKPGVTFTYPQGRPASLAPAQTTTFSVQLTGNHGGVPANNPAMFLSMNGVAFVSVPLTSLGVDLYRVTIPPQNCATGVRYYITAQETGGTTFADPPGAPANVYMVAAFDTASNILVEDFERPASDWSVQNDASLTSGAWERGNANGTWYEGVRAAPEDDASPAGSNAYVTGLGSHGAALGSHDVDGGPTHLISPTFDLSGSNAIISFKRWFYSNTPGDVLQVALSNDNGATWTTVASYSSQPVPNWNSFSAEYQQTAWIASSLQVRDYVTPTSHMRIRFTANDATPAGYVEAGIDDVIVRRFVCANQTCLGDVTDDRIVNVDDLLAVITAWGVCPAPCPPDVNHSGAVNVDDLLAVITGWGECP